jgi:four helix bundle protein
VQDFRNLEVWRKSHVLALNIYRATAAFPKAEQYGLTSQIRRASVSIAANIAEGCARFSDADFARFLSIALGSASELECLLLLAADLDLIGADPSGALVDNVTEVKRMLAALARKLKDKC